MCCPSTTRTVLQETTRALIGSKLSRIAVCMRNQALMQAGKAVSKLAEKSPLLQKIANPIQAFCAQAQEKAKHLVQSLHDAQKEKKTPHPQSRRNDRVIQELKTLTAPPQPHGVFEPSPKHHKNSSGNISKAPKDGQAALNNSIPLIHLVRMKQ